MEDASMDTDRARGRAETDAWQAAGGTRVTRMPIRPARVMMQFAKPAAEEETWTTSAARGGGGRRELRVRLPTELLLRVAASLPLLVSGAGVKSWGLSLSSSGDEALAERLWQRWHLGARASRSDVSSSLN